MSGTHANLLIGIEAHAHLAVFDLGMLLQILYGSDYLGNTGFVIGPQKGCAVGYYQVLALVCEQLGEQRR